MAVLCQTQEIEDSFHLQTSLLVKNVYSETTEIIFWCYFFFRDGSFLLTGSADSTARVFTLQTPERWYHKQQSLHLKKWGEGLQAVIAPQGFVSRSYYLPAYQQEVNFFKRNCVTMRKTWNITPHYWTKLKVTDNHLLHPVKTSCLQNFFWHLKTCSLCIDNVIIICCCLVGTRLSPLQCSCIPRCLF